MVDNTPRHGFQIFEDGEEDWEHRTDFELLDKLVSESGDYADRPATGEYPNELYHALDRRILYRWDDETEEWEAIAGLGSSDNPVPGTSHFEALETGSVNTEKVSSNVAKATADYIVYQEGGETKARSGESAEVEFTAARGGELLAEVFDSHIGEPLTVYVRSGTYEVEWSEVFLDSNQALIGDGRGPTVFKAPDEPDEPESDNIGLINIMGDENGRDTLIENSRLEGFTVDGNKDAHSLSGQWEGVELDNCEHCTVEDVISKDVPADAFDLDEVEFSKFLFCVALNSSDGFHNSVRADNNRYVSCRAEDNNVGFTQQNGAKNNVWTNPIAINNSQNFDITDESGGGQSGEAGILVGGQSVSGSTSDNFTGASYIQLEDRTVSQGYRLEERLGRFDFDDESINIDVDIDDVSPRDRIVIDMNLEDTTGSGSSPIELTISDIDTEDYENTHRADNGTYSDSVLTSFRLIKDFSPSRGVAGEWHLQNPRARAAIFGNAAADQEDILVEGHLDDSFHDYDSIQINANSEYEGHIEIRVQRRAMS